MIIDINNRIGTRPLRSFRSADLLLREMDAAGVDRAVISCFPTQDENAVVLEAIHAHPDRLSGMFLINPHQKQAEASYREPSSRGSVPSGSNRLRTAFRWTTLRCCPP